MSNKPSMPFSNGSEYWDFKYQFCERCTNNKKREDGWPEFPEKGGCPILDDIENARFDIKKFPSKWLRELTSAEDGSPIAWHYCIRFTNTDRSIMQKYFTLMKNALIKKDERQSDDRRAT